MFIACGVGVGGRGGSGVCVKDGGKLGGSVWMGCMSWCSGIVVFIGGKGK